MALAYAPLYTVTANDEVTRKETEHIFHNSSCDTELLGDISYHSFIENFAQQVTFPTTLFFKIPISRSHTSSEFSVQTSLQEFYENFNSLLFSDEKINRELFNYFDSFSEKIKQARRLQVEFYLHEDDE